MDLDERRYLTLEELARVSGLSKVTLRRHWRAGKIPGHQPGGKGSRVLFPPDALERKQVASPAMLEPRPSVPDADQVQHPFDPTGEASTRRRPRAQWRQRLIARHTQKQEEA